MRRRLPLLASMALLAACSADRTAILVEVTSPDLAVPADVDGLRFTAVSEHGGRVDQTFAISGQWPHSLTIVPPEGERMGAITITVTGLHGSDVVVRRVVTSAFMQGVTRPVTVSLPADCRGVLCADGVDCLGGMCIGETPDAGTPDAGDDDGGMIESDAGPEEDGGTDDDAGVIDSGMLDAGAPDAGMSDAGGAPLQCIDASCTGRIVISEVASRGPGAVAADEFVEVYNRGDRPVDVGGVELRYFSASGTEGGRGTIAPGIVIPAHGFLLLTSAGYSGPTPTDAAIPAWTVGLGDSAGVALRAGGSLIDVFAWGGALTPEGFAFAMSMPMSGDGAFERKARAASDAASMSTGADRFAGNGHDTDRNVDDIVFRSTRDPQSRASPTEP